MEILRGNAAQNDHLYEEFKLERFMAKYEFCSPYTLCCSDCEPLTMGETLELADQECRDMWESLGLGSSNKWENLSLGYTDPQGTPALRREICVLYKTVSAEQIIVAAPQELINMAFHAMLRPGDHFVCMFPGYQSLYEIAQHIGCKVSFWEPEERPDGSFFFDVNRLAELITPNTSAVAVNFPHNPTGYLPSHSDWQQIVQLCKSVNAFLFSDEMYRLLERDSSDRLPAAVDCYERAVSLSGMSKAFGMPGVRIGWLAVRDAALMSSLLRLHDYSTICSSAPSEVLALIGLRSAKDLVLRNLDIIEANVAHLDAFCKRHSDVIAFAAPRAGSVAFARLLTGEHVEAFCERLVAEAGVLLLPATVYDHPTSVANARFRVGLGRRNVPQCLQALEEFLHKERQNLRDSGSRKPAAQLRSLGGPITSVL